MSFINDHPNYMNYHSSNGYYYNDIPTQAWTELDNIICRSGGEDGEALSEVIGELANKVRAGHIDYNVPYPQVPDVIIKLKAMVKKKGFDYFMDCLSLIYAHGKLSIEDLNEYLADNKIGYKAINGERNYGVDWELIDNEIISNSSKATIEATRSPISFMYESKGDLVMSQNSKPVKLFVTHSSKDSNYVEALADLLAHIQVPSDRMVCTCDYRYRIPNGESIFDWLRKQFQDSNLHMIYVLSHNYYKSVPCMNEMGAAWIVASKSDLMLLPSFTYKDIYNHGGCLDPNIKGCELAGDDLSIKLWLNNLKNDIIKELGLPSVDESVWEVEKNRFITAIRKIES